MATRRKGSNAEAIREMVVGVDPGLHGAIALYRPAMMLGDKPHPDALLVWDMPTREVQASRNKFKTVLDLKGLSDLARTLVGVFGVKRVIIEQVSGMAGQGSGFSFGWNAAAAHMAFVAEGVEPETVTPSTWKKDCDVPADKKQAADCARLTFPDHHEKFRKPHGTKARAAKGVTVPANDRAEAALLAWWGVNC